MSVHPKSIILSAEGRFLLGDAGWEDRFCDPGRSGKAA